jgi:hypothetical protein
LIAGESIVFPSPAAPKSVTTKVPFGRTGLEIATCAALGETGAKAAPVTPNPAKRRNSRRESAMLFHLSAEITRTRRHPFLLPVPRISLSNYLLKSYHGPGRMVEQAFSAGNDPGLETHLVCVLCNKDRHAEYRKKP